MALRPASDIEDRGTLIEGELLEQEIHLGGRVLREDVLFAHRRVGVEERFPCVFVRHLESPFR